MKYYEVSTDFRYRIVNTVRSFLSSTVYDEKNVKKHETFYFNLNLIMVKYLLVPTVLTETNGIANEVSASYPAGSKRYCGLTKLLNLRALSRTIIIKITSV